MILGKIFYLSRKIDSFYAKIQQTHRGIPSFDDSFRSRPRVFPEEGIKIQEYLSEEFPFRINLDNELDAIACLNPEDWKDHFEFHARCFYDDSTEEERLRFVAFAKTLIKADDSVSDEEHRFYSLMKNIWKIEG